MNLEDFRPAKTFIVVGDEIYYLTPFTLERTVALCAELQVEDLNEAIKNFDLDQIYGLIYFFLEDKDYFPSLCHFKNLLLEESLSELYRALSNNFLNSQPIYGSDEIEVIQEELKTDSEQDPADWVQIYVAYAKHIPCCIDEFYDLTARLVYAVLNTINKKPKPSPKKSVFGLKLDREFTDIAKKDLEQWPNLKKNS